MKRKINYEEDEELNYNPDEMMDIMFDEDCDPDEDKSDESVLG